MRISVITPTRNRATSFLGDCVASVACQRLPDGWAVEHVLCDDGSDPAELAALHDLVRGHPQVKVVARSASGGVAAARNSAFLASSGDVVIDLDDDDMLPSAAIAQRVSHLLSTGRTWSCGNLLKVDEAGRYVIGKDLVADPAGVPVDQHGFMQALLDGTVHAWAGTRTYLRSALLDAGPWDESFVVAEDLEHWLRLTALVGPPAWFHGSAVIYREKARSLGIDAFNDGSLAISAARARARYRPWPTLPPDLPTWEGPFAAPGDLAYTAVAGPVGGGCPRCGRQLPAGYCPACGERRPLGASCPRCAEMVDDYCPSCGEAPLEGHVG